MSSIKIKILRQPLQIPKACLLSSFCPPHMFTVRAEIEERLRCLQLGIEWSNEKMKIGDLPLNVYFSYNFIFNQHYRILKKQDFFSNMYLKIKFKLRKDHSGDKKNCKHQALWQQPCSCNKKKHEKVNHTLTFCPYRTLFFTLQMIILFKFEKLIGKKSCRLQ